MDKKTSQTPIIVTVGQVSRTMDLILGRWPKDDLRRPDKLALLNDFSASVQPGKNWGGLIGSYTEATKDIPATEDSPERLRAAMRLVPAVRGAAIPVGTRITEWPEAHELLNSPPLLDKEIANGCLGLPGGENVVGVCLRVIETQSLAQFDLDPILLLADQETVFTSAVDLHEAPPTFLASMYRVLAKVSQLHWWQLLQAHGVSQGYLVFGPAHCIGLIPLSTFDTLGEGGLIDRLHEDAIHIVADPHNDDPRFRTDIIEMAKLIGQVLPELAGYWSEGADGPFRLDVNVEVPAQPIIGAPLADLPAEMPDHDILCRVSTRGKWTVPDIGNVTWSAKTLGHGLGEALNFALRAQGLERESKVYLLARVHQSEKRPDLTNTMASAWQTIIQDHGALRPWSLPDAAAQEKFRRDIEAWLRMEMRMQFLPEASMPKKSFEMIARQPSYLNRTHWERARALFGLAA